MSVVQKTGIRPAIWAVFGACVLASPFTQKGPRELAAQTVKKLVAKNEGRQRNMAFCDLTESDLDYVRRKPNSYPSFKMVRNPNFPKKDFMDLAYDNFNDNFGISMARAIECDSFFEFDEGAVDFVTDIKHANSELAASIVGHKNFKMTQSVTEFVSVNKNTLVAEAAATREFN